LVGSDLSVIAPDQRIYIDKKGNQTFFKPVSYSIIKHAMLGLTKYLSTYFASQGIRVNCISPGPILENQPDYLIQNLINRIPMGKLAHTKDIVGAIQFLLDDTSSYITGQNIVVDGGRTTW
jgi:NAD(P)-dependent dehydrogenase (short-subunit alcohol dehydrogenase family)